MKINISLWERPTKNTRR